MKLLVNSIIIVLVTMLLNSCGYHLRGSSNNDLYGNVRVISNGNLEISRLLEQRLGSINDTSLPAVKLITISSQQRQLSVNASGRADEYEITKILTYELILSDEIKISDSLSASASYDFNELQMQGTKEKEKITNDAINRTLARKLLLRLRSALKSSNLD